MRFLLSMAVLLGLGASAWSQVQTIEREYNGPAGRDIQVGVFIAIRPDCSSGPLPAIRLAEAPNHGRVVVKSAKVRATNVRQCLATEVPGFLAFYRAQPDFSGTDVFTLEVKSAEGRTQIQKIRVNVAPASGQPI
jgi:hypothetical protein